MSGKGAVAVANALFPGGPVLGGLWILSAMLPGGTRMPGEATPSLAGQAGGGLAQEAAASIAALCTAGVEPALTGDPADVPANAGAVLAMTLREAVTNVIRHAAARRCTIEIAAGSPGRGWSWRTTASACRSMRKTVSPACASG